MNGWRLFTTLSEQQCQKEGVDFVFDVRPLLTTTESDHIGLVHEVTDHNQFNLTST